MNVFQAYRELRENVLQNYIPRRMTDETTIVGDRIPSVVEFHYERRHEIVTGLADYAEGKAKTKAAIAGLTSYARRKPAHFAAKVITRGVPYVGWALLVYDVVQLYQWYDEN